jgi:AraC family transcriptional regulator
MTQADICRANVEAYAVSRGPPFESQTHGARKYPTSVLLKSSAGLAWSISAELRSHGVGESPAVVPTHTELCFAAIGNEDSVVTRTGAGQVQQTKAATGTIWVAPVGVGDNEISITAPIPETLHLFLPATLFRRLGDDFNLPVMPAHSVRYVAGIRDPMIEQIALSIIEEMMNETAAGRMFVETASLMLAARLLRNYCDSATSSPVSPESHLNHVRLRRVLDYIAANLDNELTLADLAGIACLSPYHFARTFTGAMGVSPHRYVSQMRLQKAMAEVAAGKLPLVQIALNARFSSQASFTRAFRRATGLSPGGYRRRRA